MRTDQIFHQILCKIFLEHIRSSRRKKYHKNLDKIFQESFLKILSEQIRFSRRLQEQIFCKIISSSDAFDYGIMLFIDCE